MKTSLNVANHFYSAALTNVRGKTTNRRQKDFYVGACDEFRIHSASFFEQPTSKQRFSAAGIEVLKVVKCEGAAPGADQTREAHMPNLSATPGKYQTGSMAALLTGNSTPGSKEEVVPSSFNRGRDLTTNLPSTGNDIFGSGWSISESLICARVIAMLGRTSRPPATSLENT